MTKETNDAIMLGVIAFGMPAAMIWFLSFILDKVASLKALPDLRAKITVGVPYVVAVGFVAAYVFSFAADDPSSVPMWVEVAGPPLFPLPGAALAYYYYRSDYRKRWVDHADELPEGVGLANDNWKTGVLILTGAVLFALLRLSFRQLLYG